ncbi:MAG: hypothetical protein GY696_40680 [Gammaproteobacteria bacterium]|nr:hypothetical protein [Gammaproteobacteria bacterium]
MTPSLTRQIWLIDHHHQMILNQSGMYNLAGCSLLLIMTQLDGLYLIELADRETRNKVTGLLQLTHQEVDLEVNIAVALDYTAFQLTQQKRISNSQATGCASSSRILCRVDQWPSSGEYLLWSTVICIIGSPVRIRRLPLQLVSAGRIYPYRGDGLSTLTFAYTPFIPAGPTAQNTTQKDG